MEVKASLKYLRMAPRKVRLVTNLVKGKSVPQALAQLTFLNKRAAQPLTKLLKSAMANAKHNHHLEPEKMYISSLKVNEGPSLKRWLPRAQGRATLIKKRSSHIYLTLKEMAKGARLESAEIKPEKTKEKITKIKGPKEYRIEKKQKMAKQVLPKQKIFRRKVI